MLKSERIVRYTAEELDEKLTRGADQTDWERVKALSDDEIEASIDVDDEGTFDYSKAFAGLPDVPALKQQITVRIDGDVLDWFRATGKGYQTRINAVLRQYVEAHKEAS